MASFKITDLTELAAVDVADADLLEIVDFDADESKKVSIQSLKTVFSGSPAGSDTQIQFNDGGSFGASSNLTYSDSTGLIVSPNGTIVSGFSSGINVKNTNPTIRITETSSNRGFGIFQSGVITYLGSTNNDWATASFFGVFRNDRFGLGTHNPQSKFHVNLSTNEVGYRLDLSNGQTADAFQINSYGNTGGDLFRVESDGGLTISNTVGNHLVSFSSQSESRVRMFSGGSSDNKASLTYYVNGGGLGSAYGEIGINNSYDSNSNVGGALAFDTRGGIAPIRMFVKTVGSNPSLALAINSTGNVGIGTSSPDASAITEMSSTTKGMLIPRMTTTQRDAISSPATGLLIFNTTTVKLEYYSGTAWGQV